MRLEEIKIEISKIREKLAKAKIDESIDWLIKITSKSEFKEFNDEVILIASRYYEFKKGEYLSTNSDDSERVKCVNSLLQAISKIEEKLIEDVEIKDIQAYPNYNNFFFDKYKSDDLQLNDENQILKAVCLFSFEKLNITLNDISEIDNTISERKDFRHWLSTKRKFYSEELLNSSIIKISNVGTALKVELKRNKTLEEGSIHTKFSEFRENKNENLTWDGNWELKNGVLHMEVDIYDLDVFASKSNFVHMGVEFEGNDRIIYHEVYQIPLAKKYSNYNLK